MHPTSSREAKEFLVSKITEEAQREAVDLSEIERKMLYFSETDWSLPDIYEVNEAFDREYDQASYEVKISKLIRSFLNWAKAHDTSALDQWNAAVYLLRSEDHYLLVMVDIERGRMSALSDQQESPRRFQKIVLITVVATCTAFGLILLILRYIPI